MRHVPKGKGGEQRTDYLEKARRDRDLVICFACWMGEADGRFVGGALHTLGRYTSDESDSVLLD